MLLIQILEILCDIDDFCIRFLKEHSIYLLPNSERVHYRQSQMSLSGIAKRVTKLISALCIHALTLYQFAFGRSTEILAPVRPASRTWRILDFVQ